MPDAPDRSEGSADANFEAAVDAIIGGDLEKLKTLLRQDPGLVRARSMREHRSTLLHYVSANGVEDIRQKTPANIVEITRLLLDSGAEVDAESNAYGGRSTTLGLAATSIHPERAGVQHALLQLLLDHGAAIDYPGSIVNACLANGRGQAAEFLAGRGVQLDLEGAAGVGRLDIVESFFHDDGTLRPPATQQQMTDGFGWACEFDRTGVAGFLLQRGMQIDAKLKPHGHTGLHWAAYGGRLDTVELLLDHGASVGAKDERHGGTPLDWALYQWAGSTENAQSYYAVVELLVARGAQIEPSWFEANEGRRHIAEKIRSDPHMLAALAENRSRE